MSGGTCSLTPKWFEVNAESKKELEQWDVEFDSKLLRMGERVLLDEEMVRKDKKYRYNPRDVDWSKESRGAVLLQPCNMTNIFYFIFILRLFYAVAQDFC